MDNHSTPPDPRIKQILTLATSLAADPAITPEHEDDLDMVLATLQKIAAERPIKPTPPPDLSLVFEILDKLPVMIDAIDEAYEFVFWNKECERISGYRADEVIGNPEAFEMMYPYQLTQAALKQEFSKLDPNFREQEWPLRSKSGEEKMISWSSLPPDLMLPGWFMGVVGVDVTARHKAKLHLLDRESKLKQAESMVRMGYYSDRANGDLVLSDGSKHIWGFNIDQNPTSEELISRIHPDDLPQVRAVFAEMPHKRKRIDLEYRIIKPDHSIAVIRNVSELQYDSRSQEYSIFGTSIDITEQKRIEEALRHSEIRHRALVESQIDLFSRYRPDTILTYVNDAYCKFYGRSREELIGTSFVEMVAPEFQEYTRQETAELAQRPRQLSGEYINYNAAGEERWIHWIIQPILDEKGQVVELQAVGRDITNLKETEEELRESKFFLQRSQEVAAIGSYYLDVAEGEWIGSPTLNEIFGIDDQFQKNVEGWLSIIHPDDQAMMQEYLLDEVLTDHQRFDKEYRIIRPLDQTVRWVHGLGELEFNERGEPIKMIGTIHDISDQKQIEATLQESENRFSVIFNQSPDVQAITSVEPDGSFKIVAVNKRYHEMVNMIQSIEMDDLIGKTIWELLIDILNFDPTLYTQTYKRYQQAIQSGEVVRYDEHFSIPIGDIYFETSLAPIFGAENQCRYILYSARDVSERIQAFEKIRQLNDQLEQRVLERTHELEQANQEIKQFAYIVSHDLRAPLVNLKGFSAELRSDLQDVAVISKNAMNALTPAQQEALQRLLDEDIPESLHFIESSVTSMDVFTKAILKLSRLGRLNLDLVAVDTHHLVEKILDSLRFQINQVGIEFKIDPLPTITGDRVSIEQIFSNILTNAITYLVPDRPGKIAISASQNETETVFHIQDNGRGIARGDWDKVFEPFRRAGVQNTPGEGMGLAYVQTLVRRHGGHISFVSAVGEGTTFTFTIPREIKDIQPQI